MCSIESNEQLSILLNKAMDTLHERFDDITRIIKEISANAQKRVLDMKETLLKENEEKYNKLCDEIIEMEEEYKEVIPLEPAKRLEAVVNEFNFPKFGFDFNRWLFNKILITTRNVE